MQISVHKLPDQTSYQDNHMSSPLKEPITVSLCKFLGSDIQVLGHCDSISVDDRGTYTKLDDPNHCCCCSASSDDAALRCFPMKPHSEALAHPGVSAERLAR